MALTNKGLREILSKAGVDAEHMNAAVAEIMEGHNASVDALKEARDAALADVTKYKPDAEKLPGIQRELDDLRAAKWEEKYNAEHTALETLKAETAAKEVRAGKEKAVRDYLTGKNIDPKAMDAAMLAAAGTVDGLELKKDGTIKDAAALDALVSGPLAPFVTRTETIGGENPPEQGAQTGPSFKTLAEAMAWQNAHPETPVNLDPFFLPAVPAATGTNVNAGGLGNPYVTSPMMPAT